MMSFTLDTAGNRIHLELPTRSTVALSIPVGEIHAARILLEIASRTEGLPDSDLLSLATMNEHGIKLLDEHIFKQAVRSAPLVLVLAEDGIELNHSYSMVDTDVLCLIGNQIGVDEYIADLPITAHKVCLGSESYLTSQAVQLFAIEAATTMTHPSSSQL